MKNETLKFIICKWQKFCNYKKFSIAIWTWIKWGLQLCLDFGVKTYHIISLNPSWWISRNLDFFIRRKLNYCAIFFNLLHAISCSMMVKLLTENQYFADTAYLCKKKWKKREKSFWCKQSLDNLLSKEWQVLFFFK